MQHYCENQEEVHGDLKSALKKFKKAKGNDKSQIDKSIKGFLSNAKKNFKRYQKQIVQFRKNDEERDKNERDWQRSLNYHEKKIETLREEYKSLKGQYKTLQNEGSKNELFDYEESDDADAELEKQVFDKKKQKKKDLNDELAQKLFKEIYEVQDENLQIVLGLVKKADEAQELGASINEKLGSQNKQLVKVSKDLDTLQGTIKRARNEVRSFMRGIATDKLILVLICMVCTLIIIVVVVVIACKAGMCNLICGLIPTEDGSNPCPSLIL